MAAQKDKSNNRREPPVAIVPDAGDSFVRAVGDFIDRNSLLSPGDTALLAVSGGADSVAMLAALVSLSSVKSRRYELCVAHLDHAYRDDSALDSDFVAELARAFSLKCVSRRIDVCQRGKELGLGFEQAARQVRYDFFAEVASELDCTKIATAHHSGDQVETVLHRILRGCGVDGLGGIPVSRTMSGGKFTVIRPLLEFSRADIESFLKRSAISWRSDHSNTDLKFTRNRLRHELLPYLREHFNPSVDQSILRLSRTGRWAGEISAQAGSDALGALLMERRDGVLELDASGLDLLGEAMGAQVVRQALKMLDAPRDLLGMEHIDAILSAPRGGGVSLPEGLNAHRRKDRLIISLATRGKPDLEQEQQEIKVNIPGITQLPDGQELIASIKDLEQAGDISELGGQFNRGRYNDHELLDASALSGPLVMRRRCPGDRFHPLGSPGAKKLKDFFNSEAADTRQRDSAWLLCDSEGIVWVAPFRISDHVKIGPKTLHIIELKLSASE